MPATLLFTGFSPPEGMTLRAQGWQYIVIQLEDGVFSKEQGNFKEKVVPDVGFELTTDRLQGGCSTTELIRHMI